MTGQRMLASKQLSSSSALPFKTLIGAVLGIITGLLLGGDSVIFRPIGNVYTLLLQVAVYPYLICTLLSGLGKLVPAMAVRLLKRGWLIYLFIILLTFGSMAILVTNIPEVTTSFYNISADTVVAPNLIALLISGNIFSALANNYVPAVVIFCILFGITLQRIKGTQSFYNILDVISDTCLEFWRWLVKFAPYAVFSLLADVAGTIQPDQLLDLGEYLFLFFLGTLLLTFWIIPALVAALVPVGYRFLLTQLREALILACATTLSVVALPYIYEVVKKLLNQHQIQEKDTEDIINTTLVTSYPFGQLGNFFLYLFILFAALYFNFPLLPSQHWFLPWVTYLSSIGSPSTAVSAVTFLANWLHLPAETTSLYVSLVPVTRYGQVLLSVMGIAALTLLITFSYYGLLKIQIRKIATTLFLATLVFFGVAFLMRNQIQDPAAIIYQRLNAFNLKTAVAKDIQVNFMPPFDETKVKPAQWREDTIYKIQKSGVLRVGYNADMKPFVYFNESRRLVGYDVAYMYELAQALNVRLEFIPFTWQYLVSDMQGDCFDIAIGAIYVTESRLEQVNFTRPYLKSPVSFIVPARNQSQFRSIDQIRTIPNLRIAVFNDPVLIPLVRRSFPKAQLVIFPYFAAYLEKALAENQVDAAIWSQAQTQIWALGHPGYISVTPENFAAPFLMAYMVPSNSHQFLEYLNYWLDLKQNDGFQEATYKHWILAQPQQMQKPRWSILRDIFHLNI